MDILYVHILHLCMVLVKQTGIPNPKSMLKWDMSEHKTSFFKKFLF